MIATILLGWACAPDLSETLQDDTAPSTEPELEEGTTEIDATDYEAWVLFDLETGETTDADSWDLGFRRYEIKLNGGVSGDADVVAAIVDGTSFEALSDPPTGDYVTDEPDDDDDGKPEYVFAAWYDYNKKTHVLAPRPDRVYVVQSTDERFYKVQILSYYDDVGTSGMMSFQWAEIAADSTR